MASKANSRRTKLQARKCTVTRICSITSTGVVFLGAKELEVSTEITLSIQTTLFGVESDWEVQGWVVECCAAETEQDAYRVTLLFSDLPSRLRQVLSLAESSQLFAAKQQEQTYMDGRDLFGLN